MDRLLSLSQAARMVGVRRKTLQKLVQQRRLSVFEGSIRMSELLKEFPDVERDRSGMLERVQRFQDGALFKFLPDSDQDLEKLGAEMHRMRLELAEAREEIAAYRELTCELKDRLYDLQEQCDKRQGMVLGALITWLAHRMSQRR
jgi:CDP-4-dehydro-6-deoxyglucose reductase